MRSQVPHFVNEALVMVAGQLRRLKKADVSQLVEDDFT